ncbi:MAG TPA: thiamine diphosphokinase [Candidatus Mcinerneyibacterium sp.]|nr:thiamine diphosphokinase [Candidatus Mcinerneyibacterium sp.]
MKTVIISGSNTYDLNFLKKENFNNCEIIAVDFGLKICHKLKLHPDIIIGDFDSIDESLLNLYKNKSKIVKFNKQKNKSDTELAVDIALKKNSDNIIIFNALGSRIDHEIFNIYLLFKKENKIIIKSKEGEIFALKENGKNRIKIKKNTTFSLIPIGKIYNLTIKGAQYEINNKDVSMNTLTLSNRSLENILEISFKKGKLLFYKFKG